MSIIDRLGISLRYAALLGFILVGFTVFFFSPGEIKSLPLLVSIALGLAGSAVTIALAMAKIPLPLARWEAVVSRQGGKVTGGIIAAGVLLRFGWVAVYPPVQISNFEKYWKLAVQFMETSRFYEIFQGHTVYAYRPPGYPVMLGLIMKVFGPHAWIPAVSNIVFYVITSLIVISLARRIAGELPAVIAAALLAFWPCYFAFAGLSATEYVFMLIMISAIWAFHRAGEAGWPYALLAGVLTGLGTLVRANLMVFPFFFFLYALMNRGRLGKGLQHTAIAIAAMVLVVLPWSMRNYSIFGEFVAVSTNGGSNLYRSNNPNATGTYTERGERDLDQFLHDELLWDKTGNAWAKEWILGNPGDFLQLSAKKLRIFMGEDNTGVKWSMKGHEKNEGLLYELLSAFSTVWWMGMWVLVLVGLIRWRDYFAGSALGATLLYSALFLVVIHSVYESQPRYHMPIMAVMAIVASLPFSTRQPEEVKD